MGSPGEKEVKASRAAWVRHPGQLVVRRTPSWIKAPGSASGEVHCRLG